MAAWNLELIREDLRSLRKDVFETYRFLSTVVQSARLDALKEALRRKGMSRFRANLLLSLMIILEAADVTVLPSSSGGFEVWISASRISGSELALKLNDFGRNVMDAYILIVRTWRKYGSAWRRWVIKVLRRKGVDDRAAELIFSFLFTCGVIHEPNPGVIRPT